MTADVRIWIGTVLGGLIVAGVGVYDAFVIAHSLTPLDVTLVLAGAGLIAGKSIFDLGVSVPTPPKS